jgi:hypothetical protein
MAGLAAIRAPNLALSHVHSAIGHDGEPGREDFD